MLRDLNEKLPGKENKYEQIQEIYKELLEIKRDKAKLQELNELIFFALGAAKVNQDSDLERLIVDSYFESDFSFNCYKENNFNVFSKFNLEDKSKKYKINKEQYSLIELYNKGLSIKREIQEDNEKRWEEQEKMDELRAARELEREWGLYDD